MDSTPRSMDRWLYLIGVALLVEAALCFLPAIRQTSTQSIPQLAQAACAAAAGGATLIAARRRGSPDVLRAFLWITFVAIGGMKVTAFFAYQLDSHWTSYGLFANASWSMIGFGAPVLWGAAIARRDDPGNLSTQKVGRIAAGVVQLGFVFLFASEIRSWGMFSMMGGGSGAMSGWAAAYGVSQAIQLADRILLLWASIDSVRTPVDEDTVRRRALRIHQLMGWWTVLSLISSSLGQVVWHMQMTSLGGSPAPPAFQPMLLRILIALTITVAAALALAYHFAAKRAGYKSDAPANPLTGAEA